MMNQNEFKTTSLELARDISKGVVIGEVDDLIAIYGRNKVTETKVKICTSDPYLALVKLLTASEMLAGSIMPALKESNNPSLLEQKESINEKLASLTYIINQ